MLVAEEVREALNCGKGIVALESTLIAHGLPYPLNIKTALELESIIRKQGAVPATIAILDGQIRIGLNSSEIEYLGSSKNIHKVSRRDLAYLLATGSNGATTVAATMICAAKAKISVFATGGIGGVHRDGESTLDISADLQELSRTNVAVVCAGVKSILDIGRTLEVLETFGVPVIGYKTKLFPEFYCSGGKFLVDYQVDDVTTLADILKTKWKLGLEGGVLIANPVPQEDSLNPLDIEKFINDALMASNKKGIKGKDITPFLLATIAEKTSGLSLKANISLIKNNAFLAAALAVKFASL